MIHTLSWQNQRKEFLERNHDWGALETFIKHLERQMESTPPDISKPIRLFYEDTKLPLAAFGRIGCVCLVNVNTGDFAPAYLFFVGDQAERNSEYALKALAAVKTELKW